MAYYISVKVFNEEENDELWKKIASGLYLDEVKKKAYAVHTERQKLEDDPMMDGSAKKIDRYNHLSELDPDLSLLVSNLEELEESIRSKNSKSLKKNVESIYHRLGVMDEGKDSEISDPRYPFHDFFSALFEYVLHIDIETQFEDTLSLVPTGKWVELYRNIDADSIKRSVLRLGEDGNDPETLDYYVGWVTGVRDLVKTCLETKSELHIWDELYESESEKDTISDEIKIILKKYFQA